VDDEIEYIPYTSYFSPEKLSIGVPTEIRFHDVKYGSRPLKVCKTSWINYVFEDLQGATLFQNELTSLNLVATFKTAKTLRLHEGLTSVLAYQEQMCGMENLRLWEDERTSTSNNAPTESPSSSLYPTSSNSSSRTVGATGVPMGLHATPTGKSNAGPACGVLAMIHFSAQFRKGYCRFWLNDSNNPIRVKDDGAREVKIKGLRIPLEDPKEAARRDSRKDSGAGVANGSQSSTLGDYADAATISRRNTSPQNYGGDGGKGKQGKEKDKGGKKFITGAKIEFANEGEKYAFLQKVREVQARMLNLPPLDM
jgi:hypothetical protein